jgi:hypothetical protein
VRPQHADDFAGRDGHKKIKGRKRRALIDADGRTLLVIRPTIRVAMAADRVIAIALWTLLLSRIGLIALVDISPFPAISKWYMNPALYLAVTAPLFSIALVWRFKSELRGRQA